MPCIQDSLYLDSRFLKHCYHDLNDSNVQVYNKGDDSDKTCELFGTEYQAETDPGRRRQWHKRAQEMLAKKYRSTWTWNKTRESLQQGSHLMIWSDNDVANDFTTLKDQNGDQAYPPPFLQV